MLEREDSAKAPRDDSLDWRAIDIFIFSNGQKKSPPRKYRLKSEELQFWDETLKCLAHSQYGNQQSKIELYTTDGIKVPDPLSLEDCGAYVAVPIPGQFIQSGYSKYLIKASRSMEKRRKNAKPLPSERETVKQITTSTVVHESTNRISNPNDNEKTKLKPYHVESSEKQIKKQSTDSWDPINKNTNRVSILKINNSQLKNSTNNFRKNNNKKEDTTNDAPDINNKQKRKVSEISALSAKTNIPIKNAKRLKPNQQTRLASITENNLPNNHTKSNENYGKKQNENEKAKNFPNSSIRRSTFDIEEPTKFDGLNANDKEELSKNNMKVDNGSVKTTFISPQKVLSNESNISVLEKGNVYKYVTLTNEGDDQNIRLSLKIQNSENGTENKIEKIATSDETHTTKNLMNKGNSDNDQNISTVLNNFKNDKVVIVQCTCCKSLNVDEVFKIVGKPLCEKNKTYIIVLPNEKLQVPSEIQTKAQNECSCCTSCHYNISSHDESVQFPSVHGIFGYPHKIMKSETSIIKVERETSDILKTEDVQIDRPLYPVVERVTSVSSVNLVKDIVSTEIIQTVIAEASDKYSQTQWCGVLLEAKRDSDGHYTFHLPPLKVLKMLQGCPIKAE